MSYKGSRRGKIRRRISSLGKGPLDRPLEITSGEIENPNAYFIRAIHLLNSGQPELRSAGEKILEQLALKQYDPTSIVQGEISDADLLGKRRELIDTFGGQVLGKAIHSYTRAKIALVDTRCY